jgi:hypothetical protein
MGPDWGNMDDGELTEHYQDALIERDKDERDRNWSEQDIKDMENEIGERDGL